MVARRTASATDENVVEENPAVEEAPADVAHHGAQEAVDLDDVAALGPVHVREVLVAGELEAAEPVAGVAGVGIDARGGDLGGDRVHYRSPQASVQIWDQRLTVSGPSRVWMNATAGRSALSW